MQYLRSLTDTLLNGNWQYLHSQLNSSIPTTPRIPLTDQAEHSTTTRLHRVQRLVHAGELSRATEAITTKDLAPTCSETLEHLRAKHPRPLPVIPLSSAYIWLPTYRPTDPLTITGTVLEKAITTLPRGSQGGPSGWLSEHILPLVLNGTHLTAPLER